MDRRKKLIVGSIVALAVIGGGTGIAIANGLGDDEPLTGSTLEQATAAALEHTGGGMVIESEAGDDGAAYGVEIRLDDGSVVEVALDENFNVIGQESDDDGANEEQESGEGADDD
jgi:hypothetical protein